MAKKAEVELFDKHLALIDDAVEAFKPAVDSQLEVEQNTATMDRAKEDLDNAKFNASHSSVEAFVALADKVRQLNEPLGSAHIKLISERAAAAISTNENVRKVRASEIKKVMANASHIEQVVLALREESDELRFNIRNETLKTLTRIGKADGDTKVGDVIAGHVDDLRERSIKKVLTPTDKFRKSVENMFESWDGKEDDKGKKILADAEKLLRRMEAFDKAAATKEEADDETLVSGHGDTGTVSESPGTVRVRQAESAVEPTVEEVGITADTETGSDNEPSAADESALRSVFDFDS